MRKGWSLPILVAAGLSLYSHTSAADGPPAVDVHVVAVDAGVDSAVAPTPPATPPLPDNETLAKDFYQAVTTKNWFLLAGVGLAAVISGARWLLSKRWPKWQESHYGVFLAAAIAGVTTLSLAWLADEPMLSSHTALGALKLLAAAVMAYVFPKKVLQGLASSAASES